MRHASLVRKEPGQLQEWDIIDLFQRSFSPDCLFHGPLRTTDKEEIADVIIATDNYVLIIQAKDSPNTEDIVNNKLSRKRATTLKSLTKALVQVRGAVLYIRSEPQFSMLCGGDTVVVSTEGKTLFSLLVCKELFTDQYGEYSPMILEAAADTGVPCVALDYIELTQFLSQVAGEAAVFDFLERLYAAGQAHGQFPRPRFGLGPPRGATMRSGA